MPVHKLQVFLASRFEEFGELRKTLVRRIDGIQNPSAQAVDLNDNAAKSMPPLDRCLAVISEVEIVVLLLGETYGSEARDGKSFTHLEYLQACKDRKFVLPFLVGTSYAKSANYFPSDPSLRSWLTDIYRLHCASRLDPRAGVDELTNSIVSTVMEYLWEAAGEHELADIVQGEEAIRAAWMESVVPLDALVTAPAERPSKRLRSLAWEHCSEAYEALTLNVPTVAIHHLRKAVDLVRLELAPAYWLARLLVDIGTSGECREGRKMAVQGVRLAEQKGAHELACTAWRVLAARANERLSDRGAAAQYASDAHDGFPFTWLTKFELGRQYAIDGKATDALQMARQAFWLRPGCIYKIQTDPVYLGLGEAFRRFKNDLREEAAKETKEIVDCEQSVLAFAADLQIEGVQSSGAHAHAPSLVVLIGNARAAARNTLDVLRQCASRLSSDAATFSSGPFTTLDVETGDQIQRSIAAETTATERLRMQIEQETGRREHWRRHGARTITIGIAVGAILLLLLGIGHRQLGEGGTAVVVALLLVNIGIVTPLARRFAAQQAEHSLKCERLQDELRLASSRLGASTLAWSDFGKRLGTIRIRLNQYGELVSRFERIAGKRLAYAPAVSPHHRNTTDLVRLKRKDLEGEDEPGHAPNLLPESLASLICNAFPATGDWWFTQRVQALEGEQFSRSAAYFS